MENSVIKVAMLLLKRCKLEGKYGSCVRLAKLMTWAAEGLTELGLCTRHQGKGRLWGGPERTDGRGP